MPVHVTTDTAQTITGNKTFTGSVSTSAGFTFPDGKTQTIAFTGVTIPPSDRLNNGNVQIVLSSDNNLHFPTGTIGDTLSDGGFTIVGKPGYYAELASHDGNVFAWASDANYGNPVGGGFSIGTDTTDLSGGYIWTFGNDGLLHFPDGSIQPTAFTNNLSAYAGLNYVNNNFLKLSGGTLTGAVSTTNVLYTTGGNSNQWNSTYSTVQSNSGSWNPAGSYLPLSGGTLTGTLSVSGADTLRSALDNTKISFADTTNPYLITTFDKDELKFIASNNNIQGIFNKGQLFLVNNDGGGNGSSTTITPGQVSLGSNAYNSSTDSLLNTNRLSFSDSDSEAPYTRTVNLRSNTYSQAPDTIVDIYLPTTNGTLITEPRSDSSSWGWSDAMFFRDEANAIAQRNSLNTQNFRVYNTYTSSTIYERGFNRWRGSQFSASISGTILTITVAPVGVFALGQRITGLSVTAGTIIVSQASGTLGAVGSTYNINISQTRTARTMYSYSDVFEIGTEKGTSGGSARALSFVTDGVERLNIDTTGSISATGPTLTGSQATNTLNLSANWNTTGNPALIYGRVANTASGATANLIDVGTTASGSLFKVDKAGLVTASSGFYGADLRFQASSIGSVISPHSNDILFKSNDVFVLKLYGATKNIVADSAGGFGFSAGTPFSGDADTVVRRDAADTFAQRRATNPQTFRIYNTFTDESNYERAFHRWNSNVFQIGTEKLGTGVARALSLMTDGVERLNIGATGTITVGNVSINNVAGITMNQYLLGPVGVWLSTAGTLGWSDAYLNRDAADIFAQRRGTNSQTFRIYNTFTDASNYERGFTRWNGSSFTATISGTLMTMTVAAVGTFAVGQRIAGTGVTSGTLINSLSTGTLGAINSTYVVSTSQTVSAATAMNSYSDVFQVGTEKLGTGSARALSLMTDGVERMNISSTGVITGPGGYNAFVAYGFQNSSQTFFVNPFAGSVGLAPGARLEWGAFTAPTNNQGDLVVVRDLANTLALRNSTNAQSFRLYNTYTDASNFERGFSRWNGSSFTATISGTLMTMTIAAVGTFAVGQRIAGTGVTANTLVNSLSTGTLGAAGSTYIVSASQTVATATAMNSYSDIFEIGTESLGTGSTRSLALLTNNNIILGCGATGDIQVGATGTGQSSIRLQGAYSSGNYLDLNNATVTLGGGATAWPIALVSSGHVWVWPNNAAGSFVVRKAASTSTIGYPTYELLSIAGGGEFRDGVNPQAIYTYNTSTSANLTYERGFTRWSSNVFQIGTEKLGTGVARALSFLTDGTERISIGTTGEIIQNSKAAPASATDTGIAGEVRFDADYIYRCTATNTWKRSALSTWP
jgi:hypothetical protein